MLKKLKPVTQKTLEYIKSPRGEMLRYIFIGGCTTVIDYVSYQAMILFLRMGITASNITSATLAILFAYLTNKFFVFTSRTSGFKESAAEFFKFITSRLFTLALEIAGVYLTVNILGQDHRIGKGETIIVVIIVNYILSKFLVFRKSKQEQHDNE
jgi:putative flippase GtrA